MTFLELAKTAMPDATDAEADFALWNHTPFPFEKRPRILFKKLAGYRRACANRLQLCDLCSNLAQPGDWCCKSCDAALSKALIGRQ